MDFEKQIKNLKLDLPILGKPVGLYIPAVKAGSLVTTSGQLPFAADGRLLFPGRIGKEVTLENGQRAAKAALLNTLAAVKWAIKDLNKIKQIVRLNGYVTSAIGFNDQAKVMNAASELLLQIFGEEIGAHSRVSVGVLELPMNSSVEVDLIVEVK